MATTLSFHAEHVGSLLRPPELLAARSALAHGRLSDAELRAVEDRHILDAVRLQEHAGLRAVTDGEFRRDVYFGHLVSAVAGFTWMDARDDFVDDRGHRMAYRTPVVTGRLRRLGGIATDELRYLRSVTARTPKVTLPSPATLHHLRWREGVSDRVYPDLEEFFTDVAAVYREELAELGALGATYVQLDDVTFGLLCDERQRAQLAAAGHAVDALLDRYVRLVNDCVRDRPPDMAVAVHVCRGNRDGMWIAEGGYGPIAERVFHGLEVDALLLEYDTPRAGGFGPLRHVPRGRRVVLGLVSSKVPDLERADDLLRRIEAAAERFPLERLGISPQCGFASTVSGNPLTARDQEAKLELICEVAARVWPD